MSDKLQELATVMRHEILMSEKFLTLIQKKKKAIIENQVPEIESLTKEENETIDQIEELGYNRQELVLEVTKNPDYRITENLRDFVVQLPESEQEEWSELRQKLLDLYEQIATESKLNGELLAQSMGFSEFMFNRISSADRRIKNGNYQRYSKKQMSPYAPTKQVLENKG